MSYCRFSSDNWKSTVYVYANVSGAWTIHVASNKVVGDVPPIDYDTLLDESTGPLDERGERWREQYRAQMDFLEIAERRDLNILFAGETFNEPDPGACANRLEELRSVGHHVPDGVIETLREEQREMDGVT